VTWLVAFVIYLVGYIHGIWQERKRQKENMEQNLEKEFVQVLKRAEPKKKVSRWN
jgi:hypothetical protein